jgi:MerR family copper efflux transcriptional regulator
MLIGELAQRTGLSRDTIRFYEKIGLIPCMKRRTNLYKDYPEALVPQLILLKKAKSLGLSLKEIAVLVKLFRTKKLTNSAVDDLLLKKLEFIARKIRSLQQLQKDIKKSLQETCILQ